MILGDQFRRELIVDVSGVSESRQQNDRAVRSTPIEHFELNVFVDRYELGAVRRGIAPRRRPPFTAEHRDRDDKGECASSRCIDYRRTIDQSSSVIRASGGRAWWAHFEFTPINIELTILPKKIEDLREASAMCRRAFTPRLPLLITSRLASVRWRACR